MDTALAAQLLVDPEHYLTAHRRLREGLAEKEIADYDVALIDCAPNFGLIAKNAVAASDMLLIPTRPDYLSINGIDSLGRKVQAFTQEYNEQLTRGGRRERRPAGPAAGRRRLHHGPAARQPADRGPAQLHQPGRGPRRADLRHDRPRLQGRLRPGPGVRRAGHPRRHRPRPDPRAARPRQRDGRRTWTRSRPEQPATGSGSTSRTTGWSSGPGWPRCSRSRWTGSGGGRGTW